MMFLTLFALMAAPPPDTVSLAELQRAALRNDPRLRQIELHESITALKVDNLETQHLPDMSLGGQATYQSEVPSLPGGPGFRAPTLSKDRYQVTLDVNQVLYDGGAVALQRELERASLSVEQQAVYVDLYALREQVNEAYFAAQLAEARLRSLEVFEEDIRARLKAVEAGIQAGSILPGVADELQTELLNLEQQRATVRAGRHAALDVLSVLTGHDLDDETVLAPHDPAMPAVEIIPERRPEFVLFERRRNVLDAQQALTVLKLRPNVGAFVQAGYGRPGFDFLDNSLHPYWQGGLRLRWTFWDWNTVRRDRQQLALHERIVDTQEQAFEKRLHAGIQRDLNEIRRLEAVVAIDDDVIVARERIAARAARQLELGVITAADYLEKRNAAVQARLAREMHRIELARTRTHYLTLIGEDRL